MNLGEMKTALQRFGFDDSDPLDIWVNAALHDLETAANWTFLEAVYDSSTNAADDALVLPSDLELLHSIRVVGYAEKLKYMSRTMWEDQILDDTTPGVPTHYTMVGLQTVLLWPVPDAIYPVRIFYHRFLLDLAGDGDTPSVVPTKLHFAIVQRAASIALQAENNEDRAGSAQSQYQDAVAAAAVTLAGYHQTAEFGQVQDSQEYN